jgi:hypothetical protein
LNVDKWRKLHDEMSVDAKSMIAQGLPGKEGLALLNAWEDLFLKAFNKYISSKSPSELYKLQDQLELLEIQYDAIPKIWY